MKVYGLYCSERSCRIVEREALSYRAPTVKAFGPAYTTQQIYAHGRVTWPDGRTSPAIWQFDQWHPSLGEAKRAAAEMVNEWLSAARSRVSQLEIMLAEVISKDPET